MERLAGGDAGVQMRDPDVSIQLLSLKCYDHSCSERFERVSVCGFRSKEGRGGEEERRRGGEGRMF